MSTATLANTAVQTKIVQARDVTKVFKRDAFDLNLVAGVRAGLR